MKRTLQSQDGTSIAYTRRGSGPALILIGLDDGSENEPLATALAGEFTTVDLLAAIRQPTMVATGSGAWFYQAAADTVAQAIPGATRVRLTDQGHVVDPAAFAPVLTPFLHGEA